MSVYGSLPHAKYQRSPETILIWGQNQKRKKEQELTAPNVVEVTPLPQVIAPPLTPHAPLLVVKVTPLPDVVNVMVAQVCVLHVPSVRRQPVPDAARRYPLLGTPVVCIDTSD